MFDIWIHSAASLSHVGSLPNCCLSSTSTVSSHVTFRYLTFEALFESNGSLLSICNIRERAKIAVLSQKLRLKIHTHILRSRYS
jgi:hypothetical protein